MYESHTHRLTDSVGNKVTTWTDWLGIWHASVPLTDSRHRDAMTARKAIRDELTARGVSPDYILKVTRERVTNHGTVHYREV